MSFMWRTRLACGIVAVAVLAGCGRDSATQGQRPAPVVITTPGTDNAAGSTTTTWAALVTPTRTTPRPKLTPGPLNSPEQLRNRLAGLAEGANAEVRGLNREQIATDIRFFVSHRKRETSITGEKKAELTDAMDNLLLLLDGEYRQGETARQQKCLEAFDRLNAILTAKNSDQ